VVFSGEYEAIGFGPFGTWHWGFFREIGDPSLRSRNLAESKGGTG